MNETNETAAPILNPTLEEQSRRWYYIARDWQGIWDIILPEEERELERIADLISWVFYSMARGGRRRFNLIDKLKAQYIGQKNIYRDYIQDMIDSGLMCPDCHSQWNETEGLVCYCEK